MEGLFLTAAPREHLDRVAISNGRRAHQDSSPAGLVPSIQRARRRAAALRVPEAQAVRVLVRASASGQALARRVLADLVGLVPAALVARADPHHLRVRLRVRSAAPVVARRVAAEAASSIRRPRKAR